MSRLLMALTVVLILAFVIVGWGLGPAMEQHFVPGVWVWDVAIGGMTPAEAQRHLEASLPIYKPSIVLVGPEGQRWAFSAADLGLSVDMNATLAEAYAIGHTTPGVAVIPERVQLISQGIRLSPILAWNEVEALARLNELALELDRPARDAAIRFEGTTLHLQTGEVGRSIEISATLEMLKPALFELEPLEVVLPITERAPQISDDAVVRAIDIANMMLDEPLTLLVPDVREGDPGPWTISPEVMVGMLALDIDEAQVEVGLDEEALAEFLAPIAMALHAEPQSALFDFDTDAMQLVPIAPSVNGRELVMESSITQINEFLHSGQHFVPLVTEEIEPEYTDATTAEDLGILELIAVGESYFTGSSSARDKNIRLGASKFDGIMIAPGQTFSFNEYLGEVTLEEGYDESYVIIGNRTVPGVGGGICQVATTAFRAAYFAGAPIVERWPHAYRVGYYELGGFGPGFDATIYSPMVDLRFTNDTPGHILIRTEVDAARARLRFLFYGTDDGRTVEQIGPEWGTPIPPGPGVYEFDPTMPSGTYKQVERPHDGLRATLSRIVRDAEDEILHQDTFVSNFLPWPAHYLYGPNFVPPPDAEVLNEETEP